MIVVELPSLALELELIDPRTMIRKNDPERNRLVARRTVTAAKLAGLAKARGVQRAGR